MKKVCAAMVFIIMTVVCAAVQAEDVCIYGKAVNSDGSKIDNTATVSTSWNSNRAFPKKGEYKLCLGSNPKKRITIYLNGKTYAEIYVDGDTRLDIVRR